MTALAVKSDEPTLLDEDGLITDFSFWTQELAREFALAEGLKNLYERNWEIIRPLRTEYEKISDVSSISTS